MKLSIKIKNNNMKKICGAFLLAFFPLVSIASFDVFDEGSEGYYGNAETRRFKDDVEGTDALSARDRAFLDSVAVNRITQRWYIRAMAGNERTKMGEVSNNSTSTSIPDYSKVILSGGTVTKNLIQILVAGGYLWEHWAVEAEVFSSKQLNYNQTFTYPIGFDSTLYPTTNAKSTINQLGLLFNVQYIIPRYFDFYPQHLQLHLDAGVGPMLKSTNTKTYTLSGMPLKSGSARTLTGISKLSAGGRYQVTTHLLVDIAYVYLFLGKTDFGPVGNVKFKSTKMQANGFFFGLTYQI